MLGREKGLQFINALTKPEPAQQRERQKRERKGEKEEGERNRGK
jgi:hypothetical protein